MLQKVKYFFLAPFNIFKVIINGNKLLDKDLPRKSSFRIFFDMTIWLLKYKEVNKNYYQWGFYSKTRDEMDKYVPYRKGQIGVKLVNRHYQNSSYDYVALVADKLVFSILAQSFGIPTAPKYGIVSRKKLYQLSNLNVNCEWNEILSSEKEIICKPIDGQEGEGVFLLKVGLANPQLIKDGVAIDLENLLSIFSNKTWILEKRISQHNIPATLNPTSLNTLRLTTIRNNQDISVISAIHRIGVGNMIKDNWAAGGIAVKVDLQSGFLGKYGYYRNSVITEKHPTTNIKFNEVQLPFFQEALDLVKFAHSCFYGLNTIGWDIGLSENGPIVIEANSNWSLDFVQQVDGGLKDVFESIFWKIAPELKSI
jgi:hypothetical protein